MARQTWKKIGTTWTQVLSWVKVSGVWKAGAIPYIKVSGTWQQCGETPSLSISMINKYYGWDGTSCSGAISITSNSLWYCVLDSEANFSYGNTSGYGDGTTQPTCNGTNETAGDFTTTLRFYIGGVEMASCVLTQYYYPNDCA